MPTIIFFDREDVLNFTGVIPLTEVLPLSPSAFVAAQESGFIVGNGAPLLSDYGHARCAAAARRALREFDRAAALTQLPDAIVVMARQSVWGHASLVQRLRCSLPPGPWTIRNQNGEWSEAGDWQALHSALLPRIWNYGTAHKIASESPVLPWLFRRINQLAAVFASFKSPLWIASTSRKLKNRLHEAISSSGAYQAVLQPTSGGLRDYAVILRELWSQPQVRTFRITPLRRDHPDVKTALESLRQIAKDIGDPRICSAWNLYAPYFYNAVPLMLAISGEGSKILRILKVRAAVVYEANSWLSPSLLEGARFAGIKRVVFNHNSQPASGSSIADSVLNTLFFQRSCNALIDVAALWSPSSVQDRGTVAKSAGVHILPVRLEYPAAMEMSNTHRPLRVLHAGNYQNWSDFFPWVAETADEYLKGVEALARAVEHLEGIELVIRVRPKREVDAAAVEARLGTRRNVRVCGIEQDFLEQLAESDLLVAHFSTTIEQALQMGKPVLLWGSAHRYRQFAGQEIPPTNTLEDAVYVARDLEKLSAMLVGIRDADHAAKDSTHRGQKYAFSPSTPGLDALVTYLINPSPKSETVS